MDLIANEILDFLMPQLLQKNLLILDTIQKAWIKPWEKIFTEAVEQLSSWGTNKFYVLEAEFVNIFLPAQCTYIFLSLNSWNNESISDFVLPQVFFIFFNLLYRSLYRSQFVILFFSLPFFTFLIEAFCMHIF